MRDKLLLLFYITLVPIAFFSIQLVIHSLKAEQSSAFVHEQAFYVFGEKTMPISKTSTTILFLVFLIALYGSLCGCCFSWNSSSRAFRFLIALEFSLGFGMMIINNHKEAASNLELDMRDSLSAYDKENSPLEALNWDTTQAIARCCGFDSYEDWFEIGSGTDVPDSCCVDSFTDCGQNIIPPEAESLIFMNGCYPMINRYLNVIAWMFDGIVVFLLSTPFIALSQYLLETVKRYPTYEPRAMHFLSWIKCKPNATNKHNI